MEENSNEKKEPKVITTKAKKIKENAFRENEFPGIYRAIENQIKLADFPNAYRAIENQFKSIDLSKAYQAIENQIKLADLPNVYRAIENQFKLADLPNVYRAIENQFKSIDLSKAYQAIENQIKLADLPNVYRAIENQFKSIDLSKAYQAIENQIELVDLPNAYRAIENQFRMVDTTLINKTIDLQRKFYSSNLFSEDVSNKFRDLFKNVDQNLISLKKFELGSLLNENNFQKWKEVNYQIDTDTISIDNNNYKIKDIRDIILDVLNSKGLADLNNDFNEFTKNIYHKIAQIKDSRLHSFINSFFSSLLASIIILIYGSQIVEATNKIFKSSRNEMIKTIGNASTINDGFNKDIFKGFRFVISKHLDVRQMPAQKSQLIGRLYFGQVVNVLNKKRNWTLIEYRDEENSIIIKGWVFTRYIKKFKF